jgi:phosphoribosylamine--glycine ligase
MWRSILISLANSIYMKILLIGSGGREHALAMKLIQSPKCDTLFIAPGNAGTAQCGTNLQIEVGDFESMAEVVLQQDIGMVVVGPEEPLVKGIVNFFAEREALRQVMVVGPDAYAAQLEGSKAFAKAFMNRHGIPTASYKEFNIDNHEEGIQYISNHTLPIVLKADGLAAGKGVLICQTHEEALYEFEEMLLHSKFGEAGQKVVVESFLNGIEMSVFVITDGKEYLLLPEAKDYKRIGEGDTGLNTGGMGAVSPVPFFDANLKQKVIDRIIRPTISGFEQEQMHYKGFVFFGLMIDNGEPYVIEYNCRMGDPETEVVIPRIKNDLVDLFTAMHEGKMQHMSIEADPSSLVVTVMVSGGYPGSYQKGFVIEGLNQDTNESGFIFHSGTKISEGKVLTNGGRVLAVSGKGESIQSAAKQSRLIINTIHFNDMFFRKDIGYEFQ